MGIKITFKEFEKKNPDWKERIYEMFGEGDAEINVVVDMGLTRSIHKRFCTDYKEYSEVIEKGKEMSESWWLRQGKKGLNDKSYQTGFYAFNMKNRFGWRDTPLSANAGANPLGDKDEEGKVVGKYSKEVKGEKKGEDVVIQ